MMRYFFPLWMAVVIIGLGCSTTKSGSLAYTTLPATNLHPYGRSVVDEGQRLQLISSAVHFGFSFEGKQCVVNASLPYTNAHNYLQYELDGVYQKRVKLRGDSSQAIVIEAPDEGRHVVWVYKATEAHTGPIRIHSVSGNKLTALQRPSAPLIEFIGNSITCGAAADPSEVPCGTGQYHDQHNAYYAYGPRVARSLGTNYILSSVSGIGIYRNWNSDGPTMPQVYQKTDFQDKNTQRWDFSRYTPKVVSIALGTNDFSRGDGVKERLPFDSASFVQQYIGFVQTVKGIYPLAQIALLSSPMVQGANRTLLQNCLNAVKAAVDGLYPTGKRVALYFFQPMQAKGCTGHPSVEDHAVLAKELEPFFKTLLSE